MAPRDLVRIAVSIATIVVLVLWVLGTFRRGVIQGSEPPPPESSEAGIRTYRVTLRAVSDVTEAVGTVQAEQFASVTPRVMAEIVQMRASAGQRVAGGDTLVVLDDRDLRHRLEQAQDAVRSAGVTLEQARSDYNRDKPLVEQQIITPYDFEHTQTNLKAAETNLHRVQQAEREAEVSVSYAYIRSPFAGVIVDTFGKAGELSAPGKPLLTMYEQDRLWLETNVPETLRGRIRLGESLPMRIDALDRDTSGRVVEIVPSADPSSRTTIVRVHLNDASGTVPGMFGRLLIPTAATSVPTIPESVLIRVGQLTMVDMVIGGRIERRSVQLGRAVGDQFEVLTGVAAGDMVVLQTTAREKDAL